MYNKYRNIKVQIDGHTFDSKAESLRYLHLKKLEDKGLIQNLVLQPKFILVESFVMNRTPKKTSTSKVGLFKESSSQLPFVRSKNSGIKYIPDFQYSIEDRIIVEDVKGALTDVYKLKRTMFLDKYLSDIYQFKEVVVRSSGMFVRVFTDTPK